MEFATLESVAWFNTQRLLAPLGYVPPAEYEAQYYDTQSAHMGVAGLNEPSLLKSRCDPSTPAVG